MHVIATAGHVDHGKSTLVKALTGTDPDRLEEERRRGLSIQLGYCWTSLPPVGDVAFVDVPGHERFLGTMLSGIGPVPAVLFVVAADDPWMPQAAEHLAALDSLGVRHGVVAVTRADLADPRPTMDRTREELAHTTLRDAPVLAVSGATGDGLDDLREQLVRMVKQLPPADPEADVRFWVDRLFHVRGAGTVVTGTLPAGRISVGDRLTTGEGTVRVRGVQSLGSAVPTATGVARVALNVVTDDRTELDRDSVLVTPGAWQFADVVDVRLSTATGQPIEPPERPLLHIGAVAVAARFRPLAPGLGRLTLERALPLRIADRALLRDPGSRRLWGVEILDPAPPALHRRGASAERAAQLAKHAGVPDVASEVERRGLVNRALLRRIGVRNDEGYDATSDGWLVSDAEAERIARELDRVVHEHDIATPLDPGVPVPALSAQLGLPSPELVPRLVSAPLHLTNGRVTSVRRADLPPELERAVATLSEDLATEPFAAPTADRLVELGLHGRAIAAAAKAGRLLDLGGGIVLLPGADATAVEWLRELPQPFTTSEARVRLGTTRRVVLPLLQRLDRRGDTRRLPDDRRTVVDPNR